MFFIFYFHLICELKEQCTWVWDFALSLMGRCCSLVLVVSLGDLKEGGLNIDYTVWILQVQPNISTLGMT